MSNQQEETTDETRIPAQVKQIPGANEWQKCEDNGKAYGHNHLTDKIQWNPPDADTNLDLTTELIQTGEADHASTVSAASLSSSSISFETSIKSGGKRGTVLSTYSDIPEDRSVLSIIQEIETDDFSNHSTSFDVPNSTRDHHSHILDVISEGDESRHSVVETTEDVERNAIAFDAVSDLTFESESSRPASSVQYRASVPSVSTKLPPGSLGKPPEQTSVMPSDQAQLPPASATTCTSLDNVEPKMGNHCSVTKNAMPTTANGGDLEWSKATVDDMVTSAGNVVPHKMMKQQPPDFFAHSRTTNAIDRSIDHTVNTVGSQVRELDQTIEPFVGKEIPLLVRDPNKCHQPSISDYPSIQDTKCAESSRQSVPKVRGETNYRLFHERSMLHQLSAGELFPPPASSSPTHSTTFRLTSSMPHILHSAPQTWKSSGEITPNVDYHLAGKERNISAKANQSVPQVMVLPVVYPKDKFGDRRCGRCCQGHCSWKYTGSAQGQSTEVKPQPHSAQIRPHHHAKNMNPTRRHRYRSLQRPCPIHSQPPVSHSPPDPVIPTYRTLKFTAKPQAMFKQEADPPLPSLYRLQVPTDHYLGGQSTHYNQRTLVRESHWSRLFDATREGLLRHRIMLRELSRE